MYVKYGEGQENFQLWGLSPYDTDEQINEYKAQYGITNPCAGADGSGHEAILTVIDGLIFFGYPCYCVICPDKKMQFQVCFPPSVECFDPHILNCMTLSVEDAATDDEKMISIYPIPAQDYVNINLQLNGNIDVRIMDLLGKEVYQQTFYPTGNLTGKVFVGDLGEGMYLINITTNQQNYTRKLILKR